MTKRSLACLVLLLLVAGCTGRSAGEPGTAQDDETPSDRRSTVRGPAEDSQQLSEVGNFSWEGQTEVVIADTTYRWHDPSPTNPIEAYNLASQPVANPCIWENAGQQEVYFNNRPVGLGPGGFVWPGTGSIRVELSWGPQDYAFNELAMAWQNTSHDALTNTGFIRNGVPGEIQVRPGMWDNPDWGSTSWDFWVCVSDDQDRYPGRAFAGSFHMTMTIVKDPALG